MTFPPILTSLSRIPLRAIRRIYRNGKHERHDLILRVCNIDHVGIAQVKQFLRDMYDRAAARIHIIIPCHEIAFAPPAVVIQIVFRAKQSEPFLDAPIGSPTDLDFEGRQKKKIAAE
jgi:hypothetical protein